MKIMRNTLVKIFSLCLVVYVFLACAFYFLAGEQLHLRNSRGNLEMPTADMAIAELIQGTVVEQTFSAEIQRLETISVQWSNSYRINAGTVTMELHDLTSGTILLSQVFDAATIADGQILTMTAEVPIENVYGVPLMIRLYADSASGSAVSPLMNSAIQQNGQTLSVNGGKIDGCLCFSATGTDYIWTGLHYWQFVAVFGVILALICFVVFWKFKKGKHSYIINAVVAIRKYRFLMGQLISRDFKTKYKRSILGVFWSFLNPLLTMSVQYFVFSTIFKADIAYYPVYLLIGIVFFNFFLEACGMSMTAILGNANLITKVYIPKYIYPLTRVMSSVINLAISLIPLLIVSIVTKVNFEKAAILAFYFIGCLIIFSLGFSLLLSSSMVFFRDTQFLWGVFSTIWMYATPIFYPESILPEKYRIIHQINPLYHFLKNIRMCVLDGISPEPVAYAQCMLMALGMLLVGALIFYKTQDKFVLYI